MYATACQTQHLALEGNSCTERSEIHVDECLSVDTLEGAQLKIAHQSFQAHGIVQ